MSKQKAKLIVALDVETFDEARHLVDALSKSVDIFKVGSQLFTACGPGAVQYILDKGKDVFLDLKFHDIPNTVASATSSTVKLNSVRYDVIKEDKKEDKARGRIILCTLHITGGEEMLKKAAEAAKKESEKIGAARPYLVGITVLTSDEQKEDLVDIVLSRARLAKNCGLDGVVASGQEAALIRKEMGEDFIIVTPGIRPQGADAQDQKRITTPADAIKAGSNFLVVGRPIVKAEHPLKAAQEIVKQIEKSLA